MKMKHAHIHLAKWFLVVSAIFLWTTPALTVEVNQKIRKDNLEMEIRWAGGYMKTFCLAEQGNRRLAAELKSENEAAYLLFISTTIRNYSDKNLTFNLNDFRLKVSDQVLTPTAYLVNTRFFVVTSQNPQFSIGPKKEMKVSIGFTGVPKAHTSLDLDFLDLPGIGFSKPPIEEAKHEDSSPQGVSTHLSPSDATLAKSQSQASNAPPILMGKVFAGFFPAAGRKLPLPPGSWTVLADLRTGPESSAYFLGTIENKRLVGAVTFILESFREGVQYKAATQCADPHNLYAITESNQDARDGGSQAFWFIHNIFATVWGQWADKKISMDPLFKAAVGEMEIRQITFPQDLIQVNFWRLEKWGRVVGSYFFSPEAEHITSKTVSNWKESDWSYLNYAKYPEKVAYINKLKEWGQAWWPRFKNCVDSH